MLFDGTTSGYAITGGNDKKIRYWSFSDPHHASMIINSPTDEEVQYSVEKITKETIIVAERSVNQKEFPILSQQRLKETSSVGQYTYVNVGGTNTLVKYSGNSSCKYLSCSNHLLFVDNNVVADIVQQRQQQPNTQADGGKLD